MNLLVPIAVASLALLAAAGVLLHHARWAFGQRGRVRRAARRGGQLV